MTEGKKKEKDHHSQHQKASHQKAVANITNGFQRLSVNQSIQQQHGQGHVKSPPLPPPPAAKKKGSNNKLNNDAFGKKDLYAGAAFDVSPAASSLPIPKFAMKKSDESSKMRPISVEELLQSGHALSCPSPTTIPQSVDNIPVIGSHKTEAEQLRMKSEYLMKVFASKDNNSVDKNSTVQKPAPNTDQLEEMTAQVRKLLNLKPT